MRVLSGVIFGMLAFPAVAAEPAQQPQSGPAALAAFVCQSLSTSLAEGDALRAQVADLQKQIADAKKKPEDTKTSP